MSAKPSSPPARRGLSRRAFVALFVGAALCFVPVVVDLGVVTWIVPAGWSVLSAIRHLLNLEARPALGFALHAAFYTFGYYLAARIAHARILRLGRAKGVRTLQVGVILALFATSFLRVLTYSSLRGRGGTYTFWTAAGRVLETWRR